VIAFAADVCFTGHFDAERLGHVPPTKLRGYSRVAPAIRDGNRATSTHDVSMVLAKKRRNLAELSAWEPVGEAPHPHAQAEVPLDVQVAPVEPRFGPAQREDSR